MAALQAASLWDAEVLLNSWQLAAEAAPPGTAEDYWASLFDPLGPCADNVREELLEKQRLFGVAMLPLFLTEIGVLEPVYTGPPVGTGAEAMSAAEAAVLREQLDRQEIRGLLTMISAKLIPAP